MYLGYKRAHAAAAFRNTAPGVWQPQERACSWITMAESLMWSEGLSTPHFSHPRRLG